MDFFKNFFNEESTIIGLCGFNLEKRRYNKSMISSQIFSPQAASKKVFETKFEKNIFLSL